ncbi:MAG: pyrroline-5-carboxylate reductase [Thermodesulfobacteriota bacterium]
MAEIAFIGAGKMAEALVSGIISAGIFEPGSVAVSDVSARRVSEMGKKYGVRIAPGNVSAAQADCVVFAVKPQNMADALSDVRNAGRGNDALFVSIAAGVRTSFIRESLSARRVFRVMPNLPATEGAGASAVCGDGEKGDFEMVENLFGSVGEVEFVDEELMDAFTALSGSGPAFAAAFASALVSAGEKLGIPPASARRFAVQTLFGSAKMMKGGISPDELEKAVSSPGGTTVEGLAALRESGFQSAVENALRAARKRAGELSAVQNNEKNRGKT